MRTFSINEKLIKAKDIDYNMICDFEESGVSIDQIKEKPMSALRLYIAFCMDASPEKAGSEIGEHLVKGGNLEKVFEIFKDAMEESSFFQAVSKDKETTDSENTSEEGEDKA
jgi:hypothetical protein